jgi:hypothetical protein
MFSLTQPEMLFNYDVAKKSTHYYPTNGKPVELKEGFNIFEYDYIFIPVCKDLHYILIVINIKNNEIKAYDSLNYFEENILLDMLGFINTWIYCEYEATYKTKLTGRRWAIEIAVSI